MDTICYRETIGNCRETIRDGQMLTLPYIVPSCVVVVCTLMCLGVAKILCPRVASVESGSRVQGQYLHQVIGTTLHGAHDKDTRSAFVRIDEWVGTRLPVDGSLVDVGNITSQLPTFPDEQTRQKGNQGAAEYNCFRSAHISLERRRSTTFVGFER